jgi:hypothetical protein
MRSFPVLLCLFWTLVCLPDAAQEEKSVPDEIKVLMELAAGGDAGAQFSLGFRYDIGAGVPRDDEEAVKWYRLAAEQAVNIIKVGEDKYINVDLGWALSGTDQRSATQVTRLLSSHLTGLGSSRACFLKRPQ